MWTYLTGSLPGLPLWAGPPGCRARAMVVVVSRCRFAVVGSTAWIADAGNPRTRWPVTANTADGATRAAVSAFSADAHQPSAGTTVRAGLPPHHPDCSGRRRRRPNSGCRRDIHKRCQDLIDHGVEHVGLRCSRGVIPNADPLRLVGLEIFLISCRRSTGTEGFPNSLASERADRELGSAQRPSVPWVFSSSVIWPPHTAREPASPTR